jgi:hypothetical protein
MPSADDRKRQIRGVFFEASNIVDDVSWSFNPDGAVVDMPATDQRNGLRLTFVVTANDGVIVTKGTEDMLIGLSLKDDGIEKRIANVIRDEIDKATRNVDTPHLARDAERDVGRSNELPESQAEEGQMTLTETHIELLRQLEAKPQVSSVRLPAECHDLEQTGYAKITPLNLQVSRVEITLAGRVALQRVTRGREQ